MMFTCRLHKLPLDGEPKLIRISRKLWRFDLSNMSCYSDNRGVEDEDPIPFWPTDECKNHWAAISNISDDLSAAINPLPEEGMQEA